MFLTPGERLGPYEVIEPLGAGGMGEVYRARDTRLGRDVALKVLPEVLAADPERVARFEREARALAALDHPNIVHIYSVQSEGEIPFLTMQLVRGESLSGLIPETGMALGRFFEIAKPLSEAVRAAHERGILHRDLKPDNVMVDEQGHLKVLDFGLAKLRPRVPPSEVTRLETATMSLTRRGMVMGTVPYMAPEQIQGKSVDFRSDLFSLGVILYEMATGRRPFSGANDADLVSSILRDTPPLPTDLRPTLPRGLGALVARCLEKDPDRRFQSAAEVCAALDDLERTLGRGASPSSHASATGQGGPGTGSWLESAQARVGDSVRRRPILSASVALVLVALALLSGTSWFFASRSGGPEDSKDTATARIETSHRRVTSQSGVEQYPSLSPDGKWLAYSGESEDKHDIYLQRLDGRRAINLTGASRFDDKQPAFSPDGERIAFRSDRDGGGLFIMEPTGEAVRRVTRFGFTPAWSPEGDRLVFATENVELNPLNWQGQSELWTVDVVSGETRRLTGSDGVQPSWSPCSRWIVYTGRLGDPTQMDIWAVPAEGGEPAALTRDAETDWSPVWSPDCRFVYFVSDRSGSMNLWRLPIDAETGRPEGDPEPITTPSTFVAHVALSGDGRSVVYTSSHTTQNVQKLRLDPSTADTLGDPVWVTSGSILWSSPDPSPDGEWIVFYSRVDPEGDLYLARSDGTGLRQLTSDEGQDRVPRWSPDGDWISYFSNRSGRLQLWKIRPDGSDRLRLTDLESASLAAWSPDGQRIAVYSFILGRTHLIDSSRSGREQSPVKLPAREEDLPPFVPTSWSPDGEDLLGQAGFPGEGVVTYSLRDRVFEPLTDYGEWPDWLPDGRRAIFVYGGSELHVVDRRTKEVRKIFSVPRDVLGPPRLSASGEELFFTRRVTEADVWLLSLR